ncbi:MAG: response regulator transcription factor [Ramlibacter sp.]|nr:response regulator transcription factor [Ramlibacter sp.]
MTPAAPVQDYPTRLASATAGQPVSAMGGILVVDDHDLVRLGFRSLLQVQMAGADPPVAVFEAQTLAGALAVYAANEFAIGVVLLDLALPDTQGVGALLAFRARFPAARVVVLSGTGDKAVAESALALGATAFLSKSGDLAEVLRFIQERGLFQGRAFTADAPWPADGRAGGSAEMATRQTLTPRQIQMLEWILAGKSNREIARVAKLSEGTVKNHVSTLLLVFGARSRAQLISSLR